MKSHTKLHFFSQTERGDSEQIYLTLQDIQRRPWNRVGIRCLYTMIPLVGRVKRTVTFLRHLRPETTILTLSRPMCSCLNSGITVTVPNLIPGIFLHRVRCRDLPHFQWDKLSSRNVYTNSIPKTLL